MHNIIMYNRNTGIMKTKDKEGIVIIFSFTMTLKSWVLF